VHVFVRMYTLVHVCVCVCVRMYLQINPFVPAYNNLTISSVHVCICLCVCVDGSGFGGEGRHVY